jgi:HEAT repeat protein
MLWLLDGIDEIRGQAARADFLADLLRLAEQHPQDRFVVATRPAGAPRDGLGTGWIRNELTELSPPQIEAVLDRWAAVLERKEALTLNAASMAAQLTRDTGLRQVRANALMLTMAILFYKRNHRLPHDRWEFYTGAEQALRDAWARWRASDRAARDLPGGYAVEVLEDLALHGMRAETVLFSEAEVIAAAERSLRTHDYRGRERDEEIGRFVAAARDAIGVLVEQGPGVFGFLHLTFQEFLAARAICKLSPPGADEVVAQWWDHRDWEETWRLYALGCESLNGRSEALFATILGKEQRHPLDADLHRPERVALWLAGVGTRTLPPSAQRSLASGLRMLATPDALWQLTILGILAEWDRPYSSETLAALLVARTDRYAHLRYAAVKALGTQLDDLAARTELLSAFKGADPELREVAARALAGHLENPEIFATLMAGAKDDRWRVREISINALAARPRDAAIRPVLLAACKDIAWLVRAAAVRAFVPWSDDLMVQAILLDACKDENGKVRHIAAEALALRAGIPTVRTELLRMSNNPDEGSRIAAIRALALCTEDQSVSAIMLTACKDNNWSVRHAAIETLTPRCVAHPAVRSAVLAATNDSNGEVRGAAVRALVSCNKDPAVHDALLRACRDYYPPVRSAAVRALPANCRDPTIRGALVAAICDGNGLVRQAGIQALARIADEAEVRTMLVTACKDEDGDVRSVAVRALSAFAGDPIVGPILLAACKDDEWLVQYSAIGALASRLDDPNVYAAFAAATRAGDRDVRSAAKRALEYWLVRQKSPIKQSNKHLSQSFAKS